MLTYHHYLRKQFEAVFNSSIFETMNYLAHIYLSGDSDGIKIGNFIGDYVKGKQFLGYREDIQQGILLHRLIDHFTDHHPLVKECNRLLRPGYGKYAGVVTDIFFDHFLASAWSHYSAVPLKQYSKNFYALLLQNFMVLPTHVKLFIPFMIQHKRLTSYADLSGIEQSLRIMGNRTSLPEESEYALALLRKEYQLFAAIFSAFFPELITYVENEGGYPIARPAESLGALTAYPDRASELPG